MTTNSKILSYIKVSERLNLSINFIVKDELKYYEKSKYNSVENKKPNNNKKPKITNSFLFSSINQTKKVSNYLSNSSSCSLI